METHPLQTNGLAIASSILGGAAVTADILIILAIGTPILAGPHRRGFLGNQREPAHPYALIPNTGERRCDSCVSSALAM